MVAKFDILEKERENAEPRETHHPNESAVTYPFMLGKFMLMSGMPLDKNVTFTASVVDDMLKFMAKHGQKTVSSYTAKLGKYSTIKGPTSNVDVFVYLNNILQHEDFVTAADDSADNKFISNHLLTLKRIIRLVYICTDYKTPWGLMNVKNDAFVDDLVKMYDAETNVNAPDMMSLSMLWYLCIGRGNICSVMVDHWEQSAGNELAKLLGKPSDPDFGMPPHAFPLDKPVTEDFAPEEFTFSDSE